MLSQFLMCNMQRQYRKHKDKKGVLPLLINFIIFLSAAALPPQPDATLPSVGITASDLPPSSTGSPDRIPTVDGTISPTLECTSEHDKEFKFILSTRRNSTGHWLTDMDMRPGEYARSGNSPFEVHLEHRTRTCLSCQDAVPPYARISLSEPPPTRVPKVGGYRYFPGYGFYKRHLEERTWHDARAICQGEGGDLVVINSESEAKALLELSAPLLFLQPAAKWNAEAYVGVHDLHDESAFVAVDGTPLNETGYVHWSPGEPNNHREEDCVTIVRNAMFNDVKCHKLFEFICEVSE